MPALALTVDDVPVVTVSTRDYDIVTIRVSGCVVDENFLELEVDASRHPESAEPTYHIFVSTLALLPGQKVQIRMLDQAESSQLGKTIDELFPNEEFPSDDTDFTLNAEVFAELRKKPRLREKYTLQIASTSGAAFSGDTIMGTHGVTLSVLWNAWTPDSARASLRSYTIDELEHSAPTTSYFMEKIQVGDVVSMISSE